MQAFAERLLADLVLPLVVVEGSGRLVWANPAAQEWAGRPLDSGRGSLLDDLSPDEELAALVERVRDREQPVQAFGLVIGLQRHAADAVLTPLGEGRVAMLLFPRPQAARGLVWPAERMAAGAAAVLAHEIRNPLAAIRGAAQLLGQAEPGEAAELRQLVVAEVDRVGRLVDRMEALADHRPPSLAPVNIHEVLARARRVALSGHEGSARIVERYDVSLPPVLGDLDRLIQLFVNLLANALAASPNGEIAIETAFRGGLTVDRDGERVALPIAITVADDGHGPPPEIAGHLFEPFVTSRRGGRGLGLALAARIVREHGGRIDWMREGGRTLFQVALARARGDAAEPAG